MSSKTRNAEKRREREEQSIREDKERARLEARSLYEKISDAQDVYDIKEVLFEMLERLETLPGEQP